MLLVKGHSTRGVSDSLPHYSQTKHLQPSNVIASCFQFTGLYGVNDPIEYLYEMREMNTVSTRGIDLDALRLKTQFDQLIKSDTIEINVIKNIHNALIDDYLIFDAIRSDTPIQLFDSKGNEYKIQIRHEETTQFIDLCHPGGSQETLMSVPFYFAQRLQQNKAWLLNKCLDNIDLRGLDLTGVKLSRAHLETMSSQRKKELHELAILNNLKQTNYKEWQQLTKGLPVPFENPINLGTVDFSETQFCGGTFEHLDLTHNNLGGHDLTGVHFKNMDLSGVQLSGTCVNDLKLTHVVLHLHQFRAYSNIERCTLNHVSVNLDGMDFTHLTYGTSDLRHVKGLVISHVGNANLKGLQLPETVQITAKLSIQQWQDFKQSNPTNNASVALDYASMTPREKEILSMMACVL